MHTPAALQPLEDTFRDLVAKFHAGIVTEADATSLLAAATLTDGDGAIWSYSPQGHFLRAASPGDVPVPADPTTFVDPNAVRPPTPAFPSPVAAFPSAGSPLDTPPVNPARDWSQAGPAVGPIHPAAPAGTPARSLAEQISGVPRSRSRFREKAVELLSANKAITAIVVGGMLLIGAALIVPSIMGDGSPSAMPTDTQGLLPGEEVPGQAPPVTSDAPSALDAANVATALQTGSPEQIQALIATDLDAVTLLRTQALWAGVTQAKVTIGPDAAAANGDGTATQRWALTRADESEPVTTIDVAWVSDGATWKLATPPSF